MRVNTEAIPSLSLNLGKYDKMTCNTHFCLFYCKKSPPIISGTLNCINPQSNGYVCDARSGCGMQWGHLPQKMHCGPQSRMGTWVGTTARCRYFLHLVLSVGKAEWPGSFEKHSMLCYGKLEQGQGPQQAETLSSFRASLDKAGQPFECLHWS